jgi:hypothetical protein
MLKSAGVEKGVSGGFHVMNFLRSFLFCVRVDVGMAAALKSSPRLKLSSGGWVTLF